VPGREHVDVTAEDQPSGQATGPGSSEGDDTPTNGSGNADDAPVDGGDGDEDVATTDDGDDPETTGLPEGLRLYGEVVGVERVPAGEVPETFPVAIWTDEALALRLDFSRYDHRESTYFSLPETDDDDRLATLLDVHGTTDPSDLSGQRVLVDVEDGHPMPVTRDGERRGDRRAFYGVLAGIGPSFIFTLLSFFGLADAVLSLVPFLLYLFCTFVLLPPSLYVDAWYLRTTTDWEGRPLRWALLAVVPVVNIAIVPYYLITRENSRPLALDPAGV
jgi:hypothetical protein